MLSSVLNEGRSHGDFIYLGMYMRRPSTRPSIAGLACQCVLKPASWVLCVVQSATRKDCLIEVMEALAFMPSKIPVLNLVLKDFIRKWKSTKLRLNPRDSTNLRKSPGIIIFKEIFIGELHIVQIRPNLATQSMFMGQMDGKNRKFEELAEISK